MTSHYFNAALIEKYRMSGPRYTSYPTAVQFSDHFTAQQHIAQLDASNHHPRDLSLYLHIPFCEHVCYYCACNKIITRNHAQADDYLRYLEKDIRWQLAHIDGSRRVVQLHLGGGTPTFITPEQQGYIIELLKEYTPFAPDKEGEYGIEIDPRTVDDTYLGVLRELGYNRVSFGVQDFDPQVQQAVNRVQSLESVTAIIESARRHGYQSISIDLIYGLPKQTPETFARTVEAVIALAPDRLAVFNYAHMPELFGAQKQISLADLPSAAMKLTILGNTIQQLTSAGYEFIGLDHFAKPDDSLVRHQQQGTLYRNFQGYSTFSNCDLLGFGISAISQIGNSYSQHHKARDKYYRTLDAGELPTARGMVLTTDDIIRRDAITDIMCNLHLNLNRLSAKYGIDAVRYFAPEWQALAELAADGLVELGVEHLRVLPPGRLLIRNIAMQFDAYLRAQTTQRYSQVI